MRNSIQYKYIIYSFIFLIVLGCSSDSPSETSDIPEEEQEDTTAEDTNEEEENSEFEFFPLNIYTNGRVGSGISGEVKEYRYSSNYDNPSVFRFIDNIEYGKAGNVWFSDNHISFRELDFDSNLNGYKKAYSDVTGFEKLSYLATPLQAQIQSTYGGDNYFLTILNDFNNSGNVYLNIADFFENNNCDVFLENRQDFPDYRWFLERGEYAVYRADDDAFLLDLSQCELVDTVDISNYQFITLVEKSLLLFKEATYDKFNFETRTFEQNVPLSVELNPDFKYTSTTRKFFKSEVMQNGNITYDGTKILPNGTGVPALYILNSTLTEQRSLSESDVYDKLQTFHGENQVFPGIAYRLTDQGDGSFLAYYSVESSQFNGELDGAVTIFNDTAEIIRTFLFPREDVLRTIPLN